MTPATWRVSVTMRSPVSVPARAVRTVLIRPSSDFVSLAAPTKYTTTATAMMPAATTDIKKPRLRNDNVMKMAAVAAEATATSATACPPKLDPAFVSFFVRLAICPHLLDWEGDGEGE